jgi:hypothetical protein
MSNPKPSDEILELAREADTKEQADRLKAIARKVKFLEASVERHVQELKECQDGCKEKEEGKP